MYMTEMFSILSRAHNYDTRQTMTLHEPISLTSCGQLCIWYHLPKIANKTNADLLSKVDRVSFESFTCCVKRSMSEYKEHCDNSGCVSCIRGAQAGIYIYIIYMLYIYWFNSSTAVVNCYELPNVNRSQQIMFCYIDICPYYFYLYY